MEHPTDAQFNPDPSCGTTPIGRLYRAMVISLKAYAVLSKELATSHMPASSTIQLERQHYNTTDHQILWDKLKVLEPLPECNCIVGCSCTDVIDVVNKEGRHKLMQFLLGLNSILDGIKDQILIMDPWPSINRAYAIVLQAEWKAQLSAKGDVENKRFPERFDRFRKREPMRCDHCNLRGHTKDRCFKLLGYPEWWDNNKASKPRAYGPKAGAYMAETPLDDCDFQAASVKQEMNLESIINTMAQMQKDIGKIMQHPNNSGSGVERIHLAHFEDFAGMSTHSNLFLNPIDTMGTWIIDTGATNHMCCSTSLFQSITNISKSTPICLPDGSLNASYVFSAIKPEVWHSRLGHSPFDVIMHFDALKNIQPCKSSVCEICPLSKQQRISFPIRLPSIILDWQSPFENLFGKAPDINHLKVFGCACFATICSSNSDKFSARAYKSIFLGYSSTQKGYKLYNMHTHKLFVSRNVIFHETIFPYSKTPTQDPVNDIPEPIITDDTPEVHFPDQHVDSLSNPVSPIPVIVQAVTQNIVPVRQSTRYIVKPTWLNNFVSHAKNSGEWLHPMQNELDALNNNDTWELVELPQGKRAIGSRSVYKIKRKTDGSVDRYKARLVAKGYTQIERKDYSDSFSPVAISVTVRLLLAIAASKGWFIHQLDAFTIKDLGVANYFLGIELFHTDSGLYMNQRKYILDILTDVNIIGCKPAASPMLTIVTLADDTSALLPDPNQFRRLIGWLLYLSFTRPDITYAIQQLSQYVNTLGDVHYKAALHVLKYLKGTPSQGLFYARGCSLQVVGYSNADWGACQISRKSLTSYCIFLGSSIISWKTNKQMTVSKSSDEAKYRALASTVCELQWTSYLLRDFQVQIPFPIPLYCDNQAALHITSNHVFHERTKHLDIDCHMVRNQFLNGFISPTHIPLSISLQICLLKHYLLLSLCFWCPSWA
ncbi:transmembrane signal receptor [Lithospermum erythrorhizon]|uniref:Transmembrane signal receptor n=1 Tax=Lithospermum erythrorhizon TaxID=34254 RepID=A0AAV3S1Z5_LITER